MMGKPGRAELQRQLDELAPYAEIAREIGSAATRLTAEERSSPDKLRLGLEGAIADLTAKERQGMIIDTYNGLPPNEQVKLLASVFDDNTIRVALEAKRVEVSRRAIDNLAEIAEETESLDLTLIPFRSVLKLKLYDADSYDDFRGTDQLDSNADAIWTIRLAHLGQGRFHVLEDYTYNRSDSESLDFRPVLQDQQLLGLGSLLDAGMPNERLEPIIYLGATIGTTVDAGRKFVAEFPDDDEAFMVVGHADVNGVCILQHGPPFPQEE